MSDEFDRVEFQLEFESLDELWAYMQEHGARSVAARRIRIGDFAIQYDGSGNMDSAQISHKSFKGNLEGGDP